jgi:hypothetical protein
MYNYKYASLDVLICLYVMCNTNAVIGLRIEKFIKICSTQHRLWCRYFSTYLQIELVKRFFLTASTL